jgi:hypothetical protein
VKQFLHEALSSNSIILRRDPSVLRPESAASTLAAAPASS